MKEYDEFINEKENDKSPLTIKAYRFSIENFLTDMHLETVRQIAKLTANDYRNYRDVLLDRKLSKVSVNSHFRNISSFVNWLYNYEYIKELPTIRKIKSLKTEKKVIFALNEDECSAMVKATKNVGKKLMIVLMLQTGLRRGEVLNVKVTDIFDGKILIHGKGNRERALPLTDEAIDLLDKYLATRKINSEYLFYGVGGKQISSEAIAQRVKSAARKAKIAPDRLAKVTAHTTRKSCASNLLNDGVSLDVVQSVLGHASIITTRNSYAKTNSKNIDDALLNQRPLLGV